MTRCSREVSQHIVDVAATIMHADFASVQEYDPVRHALRLINYRGFHPHCAEHLTWIYPTSGTSCALSLSSRRRTLIPDIEHCDNLAHELLRACGIRAMHTTPLLGPDGRLLGMTSTHWRKPHAPNNSELGLFDIWAKQTADMFITNDTVHDALTEIARSRQLMDDLLHSRSKKSNGNGGWPPKHRT